MTAVDDCETRPGLAFKTDTEGTRNVVSACAEIEARMLYVSTDYVYDGENPEPYTEADSTHPVNTSGQSKLEGEAHLPALLSSYWIVRTSWVSGPLGKNFVEAIVGRARQATKLQVVDDQVCCPTYTEDLARKIIDIVEHSSSGIYHVSNQGACSRFDFAREILRQRCLDPALVAPIPTSASHRPARRPKNSRLANSRPIEEGLALLPGWKDALGRYLQHKPPGM
jgi:dTDP-4-dehydrorhamnose reductase